MINVLTYRNKKGEFYVVNKQKEKQRRQMAKMQAAGKRIYSSRISAKIADRFVELARRQGTTAAALTEKLLSDYLAMHDE